MRRRSPTSCWWTSFITSRALRDSSTRQSALALGGRIVVLDPYCSPVSTRAFERFHHERTDLTAEPFEDDVSIAAEPLASNQARATLAFFRHDGELARRWPELVLVERRRLAMLAYPLSGGFTGECSSRTASQSRCSNRGRARLLAPMIAFRCLVVLERQAVATADAHHLDPELPEGEQGHP